MANRNKLLVFLLALALLLVSKPLPVRAATINIVSVSVYENIFEINDAVFLVYFSIPDWTTQNGIIQLWDGATLIEERSFSANNGLYALTGFEFEAGYSEFTWGEGLRVTLRGNPLDFATPPVNSYILISTDWQASSSLTQGREQLYNRLVVLLNAIETDDSAIADGDLVIQGASGWMATAVGGIYLNNALPGLYAAIPSIFYAQSTRVAPPTSTPGTSLQAQLNAEAASGMVLPPLSDLGTAFGMGNWFMVFFAVVLFLAGFAFALHLEAPPLYSLIIAFPIVLFGMKAAIIPLALPSLAIFLAWGIGMWRFMNPNRETLVMFTALMYTLGIILGGLIDAGALEGGALTTLNNLFQIDIFTQQDQSFWGWVFDIIKAPVQFLLGLIRIAFWNFSFWNSFGIIKWMVWIPIAGSFYFLLVTTFWSRR